MAKPDKDLPIEGSSFSVTGLPEGITLDNKVWRDVRKYLCWTCDKLERLDVNVVTVKFKLKHGKA